MSAFLRLHVSHDLQLTSGVVCDTVARGDFDKLLLFLLRARAPKRSCRLETSSTISATHKDSAVDSVAMASLALTRAWSRRLLKKRIDAKETDNLRVGQASS